MGFGKRRRHDDGARAFDVSGVVSGAHVDPEPSEVAGGVASRIAPGNDDAAPHEQLGQCAHPSAGDTDEVNGAAVGGVYERHRR
jgi:hypothetical protein